MKIHYFALILLASMQVVSLGHAENVTFVGKAEITINPLAVILLRYPIDPQNKHLIEAKEALAEARITMNREIEKQKSKYFSDNPLDEDSLYAARYTAQSPREDWNLTEYNTYRDKTQLPATMKIPLTITEVYIDNKASSPSPTISNILGSEAAKKYFDGNK